MRLRVSSRLILSVVLIEAIMLTVLVWNSVRLITESHAELLNSYVKEQSSLLAMSLQPGLASNDLALLNDALHLLHGNRQIVYLQVRDRNGKLMASLGEKTAPSRLDHSYADARRDGVFDTRQEIELYGQKLGSLQVGYSINYVNELIAKTRQQNTLIALLELLLSISITVLLGLFLTRNLRKLESAAEALSRGEHHHRINIRTNDEIGDVARAFNDMAEHLEKTHAELNEQHNLLLLEKHRMETLLNNINAVVMEADPVTLRFRYVSQEAEKLLGYTTAEWCKSGFWLEHLHPDDADTVTSKLQLYAEQSSEETLDYRLQHRSGRYIWVRNILNFEKSLSEQSFARGLIIDISEQKEAEEHIIHLANHDGLTGLYNRRKFQDQLEHQIAYAKRFQVESALLFLDLDQFKYINDTLGHQAGDRCLVSVANVIINTLREIDIVGRLGGDEFGIILPSVDKAGSRKVAENLIEAIEKRVKTPSEINIHLSASIGISLFPEDGTTPEELLAKADAAMYSIKRSGRGRIHHYQPDDQELENMKHKVHWEDRITRALKTDAFILHFQPIINIRDKSVRHHEALLRMRGDDNKLIFPGAFLSTAERFGLIRDVDQWVLKKAIQIQAENRRNNHNVSIAINLSGRHFGDPHFMQLVRSALQEYDADPRSLIFEITETAAVENITTARTFVENLRSLGCQIALDDFGTGYSSFHYLKNLPVDIVKIDGSFIRNLHHNKADQAIVKAICDLTHGMNIATVAEFVENEEILRQLEIMGVDYAQGYHVGMPSESFVYEYTEIRQAEA